MHLIDRDSFLWSYLQPEIQDLINDGEVLVEDVRVGHLDGKLTDFSFLIFPFSKAYEGFLKKLFLDIGLIKYGDYYGDEIRIGRMLNPSYQRETHSLFSKLCEKIKDGKNVSELLWKTWKNARNLTFHYFPHNYKRLSFDEATTLINDVLTAMEVGAKACGLETHVKKTVKTLA